MNKDTKKILIVIDMQNDFIIGSLGSKDAEAIVPCVRNKVIEYTHNEDFIIFTKDTHYEDYFDRLEGKMLPIEHCIWETEGWKICDELREWVRFPVIVKNTFGSLLWNQNGTLPIQTFCDCGETNERDFIIEICGLCTDICVISNALILRAMYPDARIIVDAKCCAGTTPEKHKAALEVMKSCQIEVYNE